MIDPCCGSGTFLTNAMANMFKESKKSPRLIERIKTHNLRGIEVDDFNATLASINMMLHGDGSTNIECDDCFEVLPTFENLYDRVLMNPPFSVDEKELKFVFEALFYMKDDGILSTILPKSCLKCDIAANEYLSLLREDPELYIDADELHTKLTGYYRNEFRPWVETICSYYGFSNDIGRSHIDKADSYSYNKYKQVRDKINK